MRFLVDENTGVVVASWLREQDYEVFSVYQEARGMDDDDIILLRLQNQKSANKINTLKRLFDRYLEQLPDNFIMVTETQIRFARIQ